MRTMASSSAHPAFPRQSFNANLSKLPDRSLSTAFGAASTVQAREAQRIERDRERQERERLEREGQDHMNQLTEEQKEEINEAVGLRHVHYAAKHFTHSNHQPRCRSE